MYINCYIHHHHCNVMITSFLFTIFKNLLTVEVHDKRVACDFFEQSQSYYSQATLPKGSIFITATFTGLSSEVQCS